MAPLEPKASSGRQPGGKLGWLMLGLGSSCLLLNHWMATSAGKVNPFLLLFGPFMMFFGVATLYDRRILIGATKKASAVPLRFRVTAVAIAVVALAISVWLALLY